MTNPKLDIVKSKFSAFVTEVDTLRTQLKVAQDEVAELKRELAMKYEEATELQSRLSDRNIADAVVGQSGIEADEAKQKITELMREIDRCIALLNV